MTDGITHGGRWAAQPEAGLGQQDMAGPASRPVTDIRKYRRTSVNGDHVTTWPEAHRLASLAAAKTFRNLDVDTAALPIDVETAIIRSSVNLQWRPMPRLFGAYINEPLMEPGILVNSGLPHGARRHTAAHELGHHVLGHSTRQDDMNTVQVSFGDGQEVTPPPKRKVWTADEKTAEVFAAWFLMPRRAVQTAFTVLGLERPSSPLDIYRLSLLLGTSYASTARHLPNLRLMAPATATQFMRVPPGRLKADLDQVVAPSRSRFSDVWLLDARLAAADLTVAVHAGDRLVLELPEGSQLQHPEWMSQLPSTPATANLPNQVVLECSLTDEPDSAEETAYPPARSGSITVSTAEALLAGDPLWQVNVSFSSAPLGVDPRCLGLALP